MPVIGGNQPTVQMTLPVPQPAPMKKRPKPAPAPQPVPQNNESQQQEVPQGMIPQPAPVPIPRAIILPWSPPPKKQGPVMRKRLKYARATPEQIEMMKKNVEDNPGDMIHRHRLADAIEQNGEGELGKRYADALRSAPQSIEVHGRRWFRRGPGNTYHTARIVVDGNDVEGIPMSYGYDDQYMWNAREKLKQLGHTPNIQDHEYGGGEPLWRWAQRHGVKFTYSVRDVPRQRDLHQFQRPKKYAADDGLDFGMDAMQPEGTEPTSSHSKPPTDPDQGRRRKQLLQQILDAAKKGHYDPAGMTPSDYIKDMETPEEPPPGGNVWMADPEDEEPKKMARAEPHQLRVMMDAVHQSPNDMLARHRLADALEQIGHPKSAIEGLRFDGPVWIGNSPKGLLNAIPVASKKLLEATDSWGRPKINNFYHVTSRSSRGRAHSVRVSGRMQTWKTRPDEFRVPWKFGLYQNGEINHRNFREWLVSDPTEEPS